jgi:hypothetical protein
MIVVKERLKMLPDQSLWLFVESRKNGKRAEVLPPTTYVDLPFTMRIAMMH